MRRLDGIIDRCLKLRKGKAPEGAGQGASK
jgi:hypothetical protein